MDSNRLAHIIFGHRISFFIRFVVENLPPKLMPKLFARAHFHNKIDNILN